MSRAPLALACVFLGVTVLVGEPRPPAPQSPAAAQPQETRPTFRAGVELVEVDVYVTDENDQPVTGLTADDFEVLENGEPQAITTFTPVNIPVERAEPLPLGAEPDVLTNDRSPGHVYLMVMASTSPAMALRARWLVRRFIEDHLGDNDVAALITGRTYPGDRQDFTSNRGLLLTAADKFDGSYPLDPYELVDLVELAARVPGRKFVLWFGNLDFDALELIDYRGELLSLVQEVAHAAMTAATRNNIRFYLIDPAGLTAGLPSDLTSDLPSPAGGMGLEERMAYRMLAAMTGGFAQVNSNTFAEAFERVVHETSSYYLLGFESTLQPKPGRYVSLEVRVTRPGLKVKARSGYLEPMDYRNRRLQRYVEPSTRTPVEAALSNPLYTAGMPMRVFAAPYKRSGKNSTVVLAIELDGSTLTTAEKNGVRAADLQVRHLATDVNHKIYPQYRYQTVIEAAGGQDLPRLRIVSEFEIPNGRYQIRVASASGNRNGSVVYDLEVPDFREGPLAMSGVSLATLAPADAAVLYPERNRRSTVRSRQCRLSVCEPTEILTSALALWTSGDKRESGWLLRDVLPTPVTTARDFARGETLLLFAEVYDNNNRARSDPPYLVTLQARLHDANGAIVRTVSEERSSRAETRDSGGHGYTLYLPLDGASPGQYVIQVEARSDRHEEHRAVRNIPIRVR